MQVGVGEQVAAAVNMPAVQLAVPQVKPSVWYPSPGQVGVPPGHRSATSHGPVELRQMKVGLMNAAGQSLLLPVQVSSTSQDWPLAALHTAPFGRLPSAGQFAFEPVQFSATSHGPPCARHTVLDDDKVSVGQVALLPSQNSDGSQAPAEARQTVPLPERMSVGHAAAEPVQNSAVSQMPAEARQVVVFERKLSVGQVALEPVQFSATSQGPPEARQTVAAVFGVQVPTVPERLHASQVPPHAVLQQTPSTQFPEVHIASSEHATPLATFGRHEAPPQYSEPEHEAMSAGHVVAEPEQNSAGSHPPAEPRQTVVVVR